MFKKLLLLSLVVSSGVANASDSKKPVSKLEQACVVFNKLSIVPALAALGCFAADKVESAVALAMLATAWASCGDSRPGNVSKEKK